MATLCVPPLTADDRKITVWPSLGEQVAEWLEANAVWGPGSRYGLPTRIDDEFYAWLIRAYQVFPKGHPREGRRRFNLCALELTKGTGKTERAIQVAQAEISPDAPVRTVEWRRRGRAWEPIGGPTAYPRLIFLAHTEGQVMRTAFGRFRETLKRSPEAGRFHITQERIVVVGEDGAAAGEAYPMAVSPDSADGDLPTWQHVDEPHRWTERRHHEMLDTIEENAGKDADADAWIMSTSTAGVPGEGSVEEELLDNAEAIARGEVDQPSTFFFRRYCPDDAPMTTEDEVEAAILEARGPAAEWSGDIPRIVSRWFEPKTNRQYYRRVWLNQWVREASQAFDPNAWDRCARPGVELAAGSFVTLGFDGARRRDSTALVATVIGSGVQHVLGLWERPHGADDDWEIDAPDVAAAVAAAFERLDVWRMYADPPYWDEWLAVWEGEYGAERVHRWWTNRDKPMAHALRNYKAAIDTGTLGHDGHEGLARHIANARRKTLPQRDDQDVELWVIRKDRPDSPRKIDAAMAGCLSWEARRDAIAAGAQPQRRKLARPTRIR